jgi:hypothetical protein
VFPGGRLFRVIGPEREIHRPAAIIVAGDPVSKTVRREPRIGGTLARRRPIHDTDRGADGIGDRGERPFNPGQHRGLDRLTHGRAELTADHDLIGRVVAVPHTNSFCSSRIS